MLVIRKSQLHILGAAGRNEYEERAVAHVAEKYPQRYAELGEPAVRALVRRALEKARSYGIERAVDVTKLLLVMVVFGADFDVGPKKAWARQILGSKIVHPDAKLDTLLDELSARLR